MPGISYAYTTYCDVGIGMSVLIKEVIVLTYVRRLDCCVLKMKILHGTEIGAWIPLIPSASGFVSSAMKKI